MYPPAIVRRFAFIESAFLLATLSVYGCEKRFPLPMTAAELVSYDSGAALVAYLGQPDANPTVCDLRARGPHVSALNDEVRTSLVEGFADGRIDRTLWRRCVEVLLNGPSRENAASLIDAIGVAYQDVLKDSDFEKSRALQDRLAVMQQVYMERRNGMDGHPKIDEPMFDDLRRALSAHRLGPVATRFGEELLATFDLGRGMWSGHVVNTPVIDALFIAGDEKTLRRFVDRLPTAPMRDESRRRVIRIHIAASPFREVHDNSAEVESAVMRLGHYPLALADHPPIRGWMDPEKMLIRGVLVRQQIWAQTATLLGYSSERPTLSVLPEVSLRGAVLVEVQGVSHPVTLCGPATQLDPTPCIAVEDVKLENPVAYLDEGSAFHFVDRLPMSEAVKLAEKRDRFELPVSVGGRRLLVFNWWLRYERPEDLVLGANASAGKGPDVGVVADHRDPARFIFTVRNGVQRYIAVTETPDAAGFRIVSRGGQGYAGTKGSTGSSGTSGSQCGSGGSGGTGGSGHDGGPGGMGGDVRAQIVCGDQACADALALLQKTVLSQGGLGGPGGSGGDGGSGGRGGSGRSESSHTDSKGNRVVDDYGCHGGSSGSSGSRGRDGASGSAGPAGQVNFDVVR